MKMNSIKTVVKWEINKNIKSPGFILLTIMLPLLMIVSGALSAHFMGGGFGEPRTVAFLDETPEMVFTPKLEGVVANDTKFVEFTASRGELKDKVAAGEYDGGIVFSEEELMAGSIPFFLNDMDVKNNALSKVIPIVGPIISDWKFTQLDLDQTEVAFLYSPVDLEVLSPHQEDGDTQEEVTEEGMAAAILEEVLPVIVGVLLFISVVILGQILMYGVIKEKKNRIVEVLLSSLSASELLGGKLISFGLLSMAQIFLWITTGLLVATQVMDVDIPLGAVGAGTIIPIALYFILGYLLLSSLFAAMGAIMKDAESGSQTQGLIVFIPMVPIFLATPIMMAPEATWARVLSFIPIFTPGMMLLRSGVADIPLWETVTTIVILAVSVVFCIKISAKIFEGSILQVDKALSLKDIMNTLKNQG